MIRLHRIVSAAIAMICVATSTAYAAEQSIRYFVAPSGSMLPTITSGQLLGADMSYYRSHPVRPNDVVVFMPPFPSEAPYVKRVIAVPGDELTIQNGQIIRNGVAIRSNLSKPAYRLELHDYMLIVDGTPLQASEAIVPQRSSWSRPDRVPNGCYVMLGDNRDQSKDSHIWGFLCPNRRGLQGVTPSILGRVLTKMVPI